MSSRAVSSPRVWRACADAKCLSWTPSICALLSEIMDLHNAWTVQSWNTGAIDGCKVRLSCVKTTPACFKSTAILIMMGPCNGGRISSRRIDWSWFKGSYYLELQDDPAYVEVIVWLYICCHYRYDWSICPQVKTCSQTTTNISKVLELPYHLFSGSRIKVHISIGEPGVKFSSQTVLGADY
jgi:hypothetical protein